MQQRYQVRGTKTYLYIVVIAIIVLLIAKNTFLLGNDDWLDTPVNPENETSVLFDIASGESGRTVAKNLKNEDLIPSWWAFYGYLKESDLGGKVQAGRFVLSQDMSPAEIAVAITSGAGQMAITIPEGWTSAQIDDRLFEYGLIEDNEFVNCVQNCEFLREWGIMSGYSSLEGYLFPDTYFVDPATFDSAIFITRLLDTFEQKALTDENVSAIQNSGRTLDEIVIAASIIEREVILEEDMALVSGILWKRYDNGWALGMCSTINYITGKSTVSYEDTEIDSPYNTYQNPGFPPTAISNPGLSSIKAAINPESSPYWFFLNTSDTGETIYAVSNEEHNANKAVYLN